MKTEICITSNATEAYCRALRAKLAVTERELASIPNQIEEAKKAGDAARIIALKKRERELNAELLEALVARREDLKSYTTGWQEAASRGESEVKSRIAAAEEALAALKARYEEESQALERSLAEAKQDLVSFHSETHASYTEIINLTREITGRIDAVAAAI